MSESNQPRTNLEIRRQVAATLYQEVNLDHEYQLTTWSEIHVAPKGLIDKLPFGRLFSTTSFYHYTDYELPFIVEEAQRTWAFWVSSGIINQNQIADQNFHIFFNETFLWFYQIPPHAEEIKRQIRQGNRVRFLRRFWLSTERIEVEFAEIRLLNSHADWELVYADNKQYTYEWDTQIWETNIINPELSAINPRTFQRPPRSNWAGDLDPEYIRTREQLAQITQEDLRLDTNPWDSDTEAEEDSPQIPLLTVTPFIDHPISWATGSTTGGPRSYTCTCGIDVCTCDSRHPGTPPTPPDICLWDPRHHDRPLDGVHYNRRTGIKAQ